MTVTQPPSFEGDVNIIQSQLSKLSTVGLVTVTAENINPDALGQCSWRVTFQTKAGDLEAIRVFESGYDELSTSLALSSGKLIIVEDDTVQGASSSISGDFVVGI